MIPPPTSPFIPPGCNGNLSSYDSHTHGESEDDSGGMEQYDSNSSRRTRESSVYVPGMNYISVGNVGSLPEGGSSGSAGQSKTPTDLSKISTDRSKISTDLSKISTDRSKISTDTVVRSKGELRDLNYRSRSNLNVGEANSREQSFEGQKKVTRRMTIDLVKLESSAVGTIESATCEVTVDSALGLGRQSFLHLFLLGGYERAQASDVFVGILHRSDRVWKKL